MTNNARTAQELADELERRTKTTVVSDPGRCGNLAEVLLSAAAELRRLAALASQAELVAWVERDDLADLARCNGRSLWAESPWMYAPYDLCGVKAPGNLVAVYTTPPAPAQAEPTMADAIAAGDGTLHGAIDYWQQRALKAEQSEDGRDAARWRELLRQHEIDDDQATHNNYGRTYPKRTLCVFQDDGEDGLEPVPCDPGELTRVVDAAIAAKEQS